MPGARTTGKVSCSSGCPSHCVYEPTGGRQSPDQSDLVGAPYKTYALIIQITSQIAMTAITIRPTIECAGSFAFSAMPKRNNNKLRCSCVPVRHPKGALNVRSPWLQTGTLRRFQSCSVARLDGNTLRSLLCRFVSSPTCPAPSISVPSSMGTRRSTPFRPC